MKKILNLLALAMFMSATAWAANTTTTVEQVTSAITVSDDVDYVITSATPFADGGSVDITNTDHAVVILQNIKPSVAIASWLRGHVYINGVQAANGSNCQVKMYAQGAIIFPYSSSLKPLTVYSEQNFGGESCNSFGLENTGGYMNTLTDAKLNNRIRSFKLKRGYMVTFSTRASGRGYSRCFIADKEDLEFKTLPTVLDQRITSYRVFQWYNAAKKGLASNGDNAANQALNTSWCYDWAQGNASNLPDCEWVPNHIYEDWPSTATCGSVTGSCHMKANNEPANTSDDHPQSVAEILANWENMMRTGMRLCTPSSWDGSDYWNGTGSVIKPFLDSIDARGWRCDIVDAHCYWEAGNFVNLENYWWKNYGRPIWVSEWIWGASWSSTGCWDKNGVTDAQILSTTKSILQTLNNMGCVERYAYWNSESKGHIYENGQLTDLGKYYASMTTGLGYNKSYEKIPNLPRQGGPSDLIGAYDKSEHLITLSWSEPNGEYNRSMVVEKKAAGSSSWKTADTIQCLETGGSYEIALAANVGDVFRVTLVDLKGTTRTTNEVTAVSETLEAGDEIQVGDQTMYLGGNMLANGGFDFGFLGWTSGTGETLAAPYFEVVPIGGVNNGPYLQCYGGETTWTSAQCVSTDVILQSGSTYYAAASGVNNDPSYQRISTGSGTIETNVRVQLQNVSDWAKQGASFTVTTDTICHIRIRNAAGVAQVDEFFVGRLFDTQEEALADALACTKRRAEMFRQWNTTCDMANSVLDLGLQNATSATELESSIQSAMQMKRAYATLDSIKADARLVIELKMPGYKEIAELLQDIEQIETPTDNAAQIACLKTWVNEALTYTTVTDAISSPLFATTTGWNTKAGTYTAGDQRTATQAGLTCWNAWWSLSANGNADKTMAINQEITGLPAGLYAVQCKATTQHLCATDQHAFLINKTAGETVCSAPLTYGVLDIATFDDADKWSTLVTPYLMVNEGDTVIIGFEGSKTGATDKSWIKYGDPTNTGDNREGWWCATDFSLRQIPIYTREADAAGWGIICLPYAFSVPEGVTLYRIAGLLADCTAICLEEETDAVVAGYPYIFHVTDGNIARFFEDTSNKASSANTNYHGLRGVFTATAKYPLSSLYLSDGNWVFVTARDKVIESYSGYIHKVANLTTLDSWDGISLPVSGVEALINTGIPQVEASAIENARSYDLSGRKSASDKGLVVRGGVVRFIP